VWRFNNAVRGNRPPGVELIEIDCHINDEPFATAAAIKLLDLIAKTALSK